MANDVRSTKTITRFSKIVLRRHFVGDTRERKLDNFGRTAGNCVAVLVLHASGDQTVQCFGIRGRHQDVRCTGVDHGSFASEIAADAIHAGISNWDLPGAVVACHCIGITDLACKLRLVDTAKGNLTVLCVVGVSLQVYSNNILTQNVPAI